MDFEYVGSCVPPKHCTYALDGRGIGEKTDTGLPVHRTYFYIVAETISGKAFKNDSV
jgi:hypothetical protein